MPRLLFRDVARHWARTCSDRCIDHKALHRAVAISFDAAMKSMLPIRRGDCRAWLQFIERKGGAGAAAKRDMLDATGWRAEDATARVRTGPDTSSTMSLGAIAAGTNAVAARCAKKAAEELRKNACAALQRQLNNQVRPSFLRAMWANDIQRRRKTLVDVSKQRCVRSVSHTVRNFTPYAMRVQKKLLDCIVEVLMAFQQGSCDLDPELDHHSLLGNFCGAAVQLRLSVGRTSRNIVCQGRKIAEEAKFRPTCFRTAAGQLHTVKACSSSVHAVNQNSMYPCRGASACAVV